MYLIFDLANGKLPALVLGGACQGRIFPWNPLGMPKGVFMERTIQKKFRVSEEECSLLQSRLESTGLSLQAYLISVAFGTPIQSYPVGLDCKLKALYQSLRNVQGNINQIAHLCNAGYIVSTVDVDSVLTQTNEVANEIKKLLISMRKKESI